MWFPIKYYRRPKTLAQRQENILVLLDFLDQLNIPADGLSAEDIADGNLDTTLRLFQHLSLHYQLKAESEGAARDALLAWVGSVMPPGSDKITDFSARYARGRR